MLRSSSCNFIALHLLFNSSLDMLAVAFVAGPYSFCRRAFLSFLMGATEFLISKVC